MPLIANMDKAGLTVQYKEPEWPLNFANELCTNEGSLTYHLVLNDGSSTEYLSNDLSLTTPDATKPWEFSISTTATAPLTLSVGLQIERRVGGVKVVSNSNLAGFTFEIHAGILCTTPSSFEIGVWTPPYFLSMNSGTHDFELNRYVRLNDNACWQNEVTFAFETTPDSAFTLDGSVLTVDASEAAI